MRLSFPTRRVTLVLAFAYDVSDAVRFEMRAALLVAGTTSKATMLTRRPNFRMSGTYHARPFFSYPNLASGSLARLTRERYLSQNSIIVSKGREGALNTRTPSPNRGLMEPKVLYAPDVAERLSVTVPTARRLMTSSGLGRKLFGSKRIFVVESEWNEYVTSRSVVIRTETPMIVPARAPRGVQGNVVPIRSPRERLARYA